MSLHTKENIMYTKITHFLDQRRLKEGLTVLKNYADRTANWTILSKIEGIQNNYDYMLKYAALGTQDSERANIFNQLVREAYEIADEIRFDELMNKSYSDLGEKYRSNKKNPPKSFKEFMEKLIQLNQQAGFSLDEIEQHYSERYRFPIHQSFDDELFNRIVTSTHWSKEEYQDAYSILSKGMNDFDINVMISAITLSLLHYFDWNKFNFLLNSYLDNADEQIKMRSLVGIAFSIYFYEGRFKFYHEDLILLDFFLDQEEVAQKLQFVQQALLLSRETEKIDKRMREEIIPEMMKNPYLKHQDKKMDDIDISELEETNPEWQEELDKITSHVLELGELQREGADTYMSTFEMLKHYEFFKTTAHWFYPFTVKLPMIEKIFEEKQIKGKSILDLMLGSTTFCNSDKYSFCLSLDEFPVQPMSMLGENYEGNEDVLNAHIGAPLKASDEENTKSCYRQYIQDLYRFFKLWDYRSQQHDIFTDSLTLWDTKYLKNVLGKGANGKETSNYLLAKGYYKEAIDIYNILDDKDTIDVEFLQKKGFAYQKLKDYQQAIKCYNKVCLINSNDIWTLKQMAHCYKKLHNTEQALDYFLQVSKLEPENLQTTLQIGLCLTSIHQYKSALEYFFKVEYLGKSPAQVHRAIAWCYFMSGMYAEAARFYEKIMQETSPTLNDWLNYGHVYLAQNAMVDAIHCYSEAAKLCSSHDEFIELFSSDFKVLREANVPSTTLYIIQDLV